MHTADPTEQSRREQTLLRRIVSATLTVSGATTLVKIVGAAKVILIARAFGTSDQLDSYLLAFLLPSFMGDVVAGASSPALIPLLLETRQHEGCERARRLLAEFLFATLTVCVSLTILLAAFAPILVRAIGAGFAAEKLSLTADLLRTMAPIVVFGGIGSVWRAALNASGRFAAPALTFATTPAVIMTFLIAGSADGNAWTLAYGTVAGSALESAVAAWFVWRAGQSPIPRWYAWDPRLARAVSQYWPMFVSSVLFGASGYVHQSIASSLGPGSVSALNYGSRLPALLLALGPAALGTAVLPPFSELAARGQAAELSTAVARSLRAILWFSIPATLIAIVLSPAVVRLVCQHGEFSKVDTQLVGRLQQYFLLQIPLALPAAVLARLFSTLQEARVLLAASAISLAANSALGLLLARRSGIEGLATAAGIGALCYLVFLTLMLSRTKVVRT